MTNDEVRTLLQAANIVFEKDDEIEHYAQTLNMNDVWGWATSWPEYIPDEALQEVGRLFIAYGWCGVLYWMSEHHDHMKSEFADINRFIEFVRAEEEIRATGGSSSKRAYIKQSYTIGRTV